MPEASNLVAINLFGARTILNSGESFFFVANNYFGADPIILVVKHLKIVVEPFVLVPEKIK